VETPRSAEVSPRLYYKDNKFLSEIQISPKSQMQIFIHHLSFFTLDF
jgi:hypothetical protein